MPFIGEWLKMLWGRCSNKKRKKTNSNSITYIFNFFPIFPCIPIHPKQWPVEPNNVYPRTPSVFHSIKVSAALHVIKRMHRAVPPEDKQGHRHGRKRMHILMDKTPAEKKTSLLISQHVQRKHAQDD